MAHCLNRRATGLVLVYMYCTAIVDTCNESRSIWILSVLRRLWKLHRQRQHILLILQHTNINETSRKRVASASNTTPPSSGGGWELQRKIGEYATKVLLV